MLKEKDVESAMDPLLAILIICSVLFLAWLIRFATRTRTAANFILEVYTNILSFEWRSGEEIGLRLDQSASPAIRKFMDMHHRELRDSNITREQFSKSFAIGLIDVMTQFDYAESKRERVTKEWCEANPHIIEALTKEEIAWHMERPRIETPDLPDKDDQLESALIVGHMNAMADRLFEEGLFDIVLCKKKPRGRRPPRWSTKADKKLFDSMRPAGA